MVTIGDFTSLHGSLRHQRNTNTREQSAGCVTTATTDNWRGRAHQKGEGTTPPYDGNIQGAAMVSVGGQLTGMYVIQKEGQRANSGSGCHDYHVTLTS